MGMQCVVMWLRAVAAFHMITSQDAGFRMTAEYSWADDAASAVVSYVPVCYGCVLPVLSLLLSVACCAVAAVFDLFCQLLRHLPLAFRLMILAQNDPDPLCLPCAGLKLHHIFCCYSSEQWSNVTAANDSQLTAVVMKCCSLRDS